LSILFRAPKDRTRIITPADLNPQIIGRTSSKKYTLKRTQRKSALRYS